MRKLRIPAHEGYGARGFPAWGIPADATLLFEVGARHRPLGASAPSTTVLLPLRSDHHTLGALTVGVSLSQIEVLDIKNGKKAPDPQPDGRARPGVVIQSGKTEL